MLENPVLAKLRRDEAVFGVGITGPVGVPTLRVLASAGVEWLFTDLEHGSIDIGELLSVVQVADLAGMVAVPRIPDLAYHWVARSLDTGAMGVMVPRVETPEQAAQAVSYAKYPPDGVRGMGSPSRLSYATVSPADCVDVTNSETLVALQIESVRGAENAAEIAAVPGVDVLFIGPLDLSISVGKPGDTTNEESHRLMRMICQEARQRGVSTGIVCSPGQIAFYHEMGVRMFSVGSAIGYLAQGVAAARAAFDRLE